MSIPDITNVPVGELLSLSGRCAVVTGGARGLGKAMVSRLAEAGASVLVADIDLELATAVAEEISADFGAEVLPVRLDVTDEASIRSAADFAIAKFGGIDIWVNNAGIYPNVLLLDMTQEIWDRVMNINLRGAFLGSQEAARRMIGASRPGVIINVVSTAGFKGMAPGVAAYVASKHGVRGMIRQLAVELAPHEIRVLGVAPTFCTTEGNTEALAKLPERVREEISATVSSRLGRVGVPDDIARAVLFCASDMAMFMTGSTLVVDAGEIA